MTMNPNDWLAVAISSMIGLVYLIECTLKGECEQ